MQKNEQVRLEFPFKAQLGTISLSRSYNELQSYATQTGQFTQPSGMKKISSICVYQCLGGFNSTHCLAWQYDG